MKTVVIRKGFKFRLEPNEAQRKMLTRFVGHARFVWNKALDLNPESVVTKVETFPVSCPA